MDEILHPRMQSARSNADRDGGSALLAALYALEAEHPALGWLSLWKVAEQDGAEAARTLSFALARHGVKMPAVEAIGLWFLSKWLGNDLSTLVNVLTGVEHTMDGEQPDVPRSWRSSIRIFLDHCVSHEEPIVRHSVLDLLETSLATSCLAQFLNKEAARELSNALVTAIETTAEDEELETLAEVARELTSDDLPEVPPAEPAALDKLAMKIDQTVASLAAKLGGVEKLAQVVRERAARDRALAAVARGSSTDKKLDPVALAARAVLKDRYQKQLDRVRAAEQQTDCIEETVEGVIHNLRAASAGSLVIYGDPQSGKTEMMICLTARLLDAGHKLIIHLMNDSIDLLAQSLERFKLAGLAPAPRNSNDLINSPLVAGHEAVLFCKKNAKDLRRLIDAVDRFGPVVVIDDEADYATPNAKINQNTKTKINALVTTLLGSKGTYIGVTATPARLNLNNTFNNRPETWVRFKPHKHYHGQDTFFPLMGVVPYRLTLLPDAASPDDARSPAEARSALARFLVTAAYLNQRATANGEKEENYSFLVHTSGKTDAHKADRKVIESAMGALVSAKGKEFVAFVETIIAESKRLYPAASSNELSEYIIGNASRYAFVVLNSERDRATAGDRPTVPTCPFTVIIGGNIVSRGVTFPNLLAMFFTRDVKTKLQQDTYIQRARMFGARGKYLEHFELTIPRSLYNDWHRCFVFHRLALEAIENNKASPVWVGDKRISIAASSSIDRGTVDLDKGEMSFQMFDCPDPVALDAIVREGPTDFNTIQKLALAVGDGLPRFLLDYLSRALLVNPGTLAIHESASIARYGKSADVDAIARTKGFLGTPQLELAKFPQAVHHIKILYNLKYKARAFYKNTGGVQFVQNLV
jgi:hypothetical protein